jgi:hypothetical protein
MSEVLSAGSYIDATGSYDGSTARTFAVDATTNNTASKVVARDANGDFAAGTITADLIGNVTGDVSGSAGSVAAANVTGTTLADNVLNSSLTSVGTLTNLTVTNPIVGSMSAALTAGTYLTSGGTYNGGTARTFNVDATTTNTASKVVARDASGNFAAGTITATLSGNASTATTATNLAAATGILAGSLNIDPASIPSRTSSTQTFTLTGLTTNHKVTVTRQSAFPYEVVITAAWASATNTLSVEFQNYTNGAVNLTAFDLAYFAWV